MLPIDHIDADVLIIGAGGAGLLAALHIHEALPSAKIFAGDGVCTSSFTNASAGGVPASIDPLIECTVATQDLSAYPGGWLISIWYGRPRSWSGSNTLRS